MAVVLTVAGAEASSDELRGLRAWLVGEDELRGRVRLRERPPAAGTLGPVAEAVEIIHTVGAPVEGALGWALVAWLRSRVNRFRLEVRTERGARMVLDVRQVKELDSAAAKELVGQVESMIAGNGEHAVGEQADREPADGEPADGEQPGTAPTR